MFGSQKETSEEYLKKLQFGQHPSFGQGWSESPEGLNNLPWRLARWKETTTEREKREEEKCGKEEVGEGEKEAKTDEKKKGQRRWSRCEGARRH